MVEADLILHVVDVSDPDHETKRQIVLDVLKEIGATGHPMITVYNKADLASRLRLSPATARVALPGEEGRSSEEFLVSAVTGEGLDRLVQEVVHRVSPVTV